MLLRSAGHACRGFRHAFASERNLRLFVAGYLPVIALAFLVRLGSWEWFVLLLAGGFFLVVELLNTALERIVDVVDDDVKKGQQRHSFTVLRAAKDTAAAASLVALLAVLAVIGMVFWPLLSASAPGVFS